MPPCAPVQGSVQREPEQGKVLLDFSLIAASAATLVVYHILYYRWRFSSLIEERGFHRVDQHGQKARIIFVRAVCGVNSGVGDDTANADANIAIQAARNPITAASILATGATFGVTTLVNILLDDAKLQEVRRLGKLDPLVGSSFLVSPELKISAAIWALFLSFFSMAQSLRLFVHFSFFVRAASFCRQHAQEHYGETTVEDMYKVATKSCLRAQTFFSLGLRFLYCFIPLVFWLLGSTYLLAGTLVLVVALFNLDSI